MKVVIEMYTYASSEPEEVRELSVGDKFEDLSDQWSWFKIARFTSENGEPPTTATGRTMGEPDLRIIRRDVMHQRLVVPIRPHVEAEVFVPYPMTEADWDQFLAVLAAMKPGLVKPPPGRTAGGGWDLTDEEAAEVIRQSEGLT